MKRWFFFQANKPLGPPWWVERLITRLLPRDLGEGMLGDFTESFTRAFAANGRLHATTWYFQQLVRSIPAIIYLCLKYQYNRRIQTMLKSLSKHDKQIFVFSLLCLIPVLLIAIPGMLHSILGQSAMMNAVSDMTERSQILSLIIHPTVIIGGLFIALLLNIIPIMRFNLTNQEDRVVGAVIIKKGHLLHYILIGFCLFITLIIFTYLLAENLQLFQNLQ